MAGFAAVVALALVAFLLPPVRPSASGKSRFTWASLKLLEPCLNFLKLA